LAISERLLTRMAEDLGVSEDELLVESLLEYLKSKKRDCMADRLEILSRYGVSSSKEIEEAIKNGRIAEHPSWEDLIVIENLEDKIKKLDKEIANIESLPGT
jgi:hypothetical protein